MSGDQIGDRMKSYEDAYRQRLPIRMPVIIRLDGRSFHTYTKKCKRPLDQGLVDVMNLTAIELCTQIQGVQIAYVQSDEISLLLKNYSDLNTQAWFDNNIQKMVSVSASIAGATFTANSFRIWTSGFPSFLDIKPATFDSRAFIVPKEEVCNAFLWRQLDATRNSIQMLARSLYSHKDCNNKNTSQLQDLCFKKGINWNDCPTSQKRGRCIVKKQSAKEAINKHTGQTITALRSEWVIDNEIPIFSKDREYINRLVFDQDETCET
jgi:tRNA(His) 5'-end guanylyltransferase